MKKPEHMTKAELLHRSQTLERRTPAGHLGFERERLLHELQVHQVELETQNRELREAQLLLETSRDRYADLYDFAPVGYVTLGAKGTIRELNLTAAGMLGGDRARLVGVPFHLFVERRDMERFREHLARRASPTERVVNELHLAHKRNHSLPVVMQSVLAPDGEKPGWLCRASLTDNTAREQAGQALSQSEERLRLALDASEMGMFEIDIGTGRTHWNSVQFELLGLKPGLAAPRPETFFRFVHPNDVAGLRAHWEEAKRTGQFDAEYRIVRADGQERWLAGKGRFAFGDPIGWKTPKTPARAARLLGVNFDITERKRAEAALRESESRFRQVTGAIDQVFWMTSVDKNQVLYISPAYERIWGRTCQSLYESPRTWLDAIHPEDRPRVREAATIQQATGGYDVDYRILRPDGAERWIHDRAFPIGDASGTVHRVAGIAEDITERRRLEAELLEVTEREQRKFGHDLHDGLGQRLTALEMVSHGLAEDLQTVGPELAERAARLNRELRETVTQARLLAHSLAPVPLEGDGLMHGLAGLAASTSRIPGVNCRFVCDSPVLIEDATVATHLYRIAQEAVTNALKHGQAAKLDLTLTRLAGGVELRVKNNGHPLPAASGARAGMGLRVMRYRAELIGARLTIKSDKTKGVRVTCTLRLPVRAA